MSKYIIYLFLIMGIGIVDLKSIDIEDKPHDSFYSSFLISLREGEFYSKHRLPLVFYRQSEREEKYADYKKNDEIIMSSLIRKEKEEEVYFKAKCSYPEFSLYRQITNYYISKTYMDWDSCGNLQKKKKQMELQGDKTSVLILIKKEKEFWKKTMLDGLDRTTPLPFPQVISGEMAPGVSTYAKAYLTGLLDVVLLNSHLHSNVNLNSEESSYPGMSWANSLITEFNDMFYQERISALNLKNQIEMEKITLRNSYISNKLHYLLLSPILRGFPAKTQLIENQILLEEFKKSTNLMILRMLGMEEEKLVLKSILTCFESWPIWHLNNLRIAYYYGFYNEYGREYNFSDELKKDPELWNIVEVMDKKIYSSDVFRKRLNSLYSDCKIVKSRTKKEIEDLLDKEEVKSRESLRRRL